MAKPNLTIAALIVVAAGLLALYGATLLPAKKAAVDQATAPALTPLTEPLVDFADPVRGDRSAPVTITLFSDYLCQPCADASAAAREIIAANPTTVRLVWKDLPNDSFHPGATQMAIAARCAGDQGAFWEYHDLLMERQVGLTTGTLVPMAAELGLDLDQFQSCLTNETTKPLVTRTVEEAMRLRLDATPYFFIGGRRVSGALTTEQLQGFVDAALATQAAAAAETVQPAP
jgi:protein-disulfide isomerase